MKKPKWSLAAFATSAFVTLFVLAFHERRSLPNPNYEDLCGEQTLAKLEETPARSVCGELRTLNVLDEATEASYATLAEAMRRGDARRAMDGITDYSVKTQQWSEKLQTIAKEIRTESMTATGDEKTYINWRQEAATLLKSNAEKREAEIESLKTILRNLLLRNNSHSQLIAKAAPPPRPSFFYKFKTPPTWSEGF